MSKSWLPKWQKKGETRMYGKMIDDIAVMIPVVYVKEVSASYGQIARDLVSYGNVTIIPLDSGFSAEGYTDLVGQEITISFMLAFKPTMGWPYTVRLGSKKLKGFKVEHAYAYGKNVPSVALTANLMSTFRGLISCIRKKQTFKYKGVRTMATCNNCVNALRIPYDTDDSVFGISAVRSKPVNEQAEEPGACDVACLAHFQMVDSQALARIAADKSMVMQEAGWVKSEGRREVAEFCEYFAPRFISNNLVTHSVGGKFTGSLTSFNIFGGGFLLTKGNSTYYDYRAPKASGNELKMLNRLFVKTTKA
jgi:hypothetical protein